MLAWISNTIVRPASKKAAAIAIVNAMGNIGSIPGSYMWPSSYGPLYIKSFGSELAVLGFACVSAFALRTYLKSLNKKLDAGDKVPFEVTETAAEHTADIEGRSPQEILEQARKSFRYLY
jgi:hypothetical protein